MQGDPGRLVQALIGAELESEHEKGAEGATLRRPTLTISRDFGSGGEEVARMLAERLEVGYYDRSILESVAREAHVDKYLMARLDEHASGRLSDWAYATITGQNAFKEDFLRALAHVIVGICRDGGVVVGRGAHLLLSAHRAFRVRITGSPDECAGRVAKLENMSVDAAAKRVAAANADRAAFVRKLYQRDINDAWAYDLTVCTDRISSASAVAIILKAMREAGYDAPE